MPFLNDNGMPAMIEPALQAASEVALQGMIILTIGAVAVLGAITLLSIFTGKYDE